MDPAPHCIIVWSLPPTNLTADPAPWPSTVPVVISPVVPYLAPVLPTHVCPAHRLSNFSVAVFQSDASEVKKGLFLDKTRAILSIQYVPAAHGVHNPLTGLYPTRHSQAAAPAGDAENAVQF